MALFLLVCYALQEDDVLNNRENQQFLQWMETYIVNKHNRSRDKRVGDSEAKLNQ